MTEQAGEPRHPAIGLLGTCDACSEGLVTIVKVDPDTEAYICQACVDRYEAAVNAGAVALALELGHTLARIGLSGEDIAEAQAAPNTLRIARKVIEAYDGHFGGNGELT